jgi:uncharacterized protein DUF5320
MPRGNGMGPEGFGSRTGRGAGFCNGFDQPGFMNSGMGNRRAGFGYRRNSQSGFMPAWRSRGYDTFVPAEPTMVQKKEFLGNEINLLKQHLNELEKQLETMTDES